ncbi:MAG: outer membrane protein assembly factor BamE [Burkholderiales bacterium]|nr:outer membrane protein assembly factor BamE [Burkholderiales bacterium]
MNRGVVFAALLTGLTGGCSTWPSLNFLTPYKIDIQQGNVVKQEDVSKLKPGMTKQEVKNILGTPLLADVFHADRWDYVFLFRKGHTVTEERKFTVFFNDGKLAKVEGDVIPASADKSATQ